MKTGWSTKRLGDLCDVIAGQSPEGKFYNSDGDGIPFYQGKKEFGERNLGAPTTWTTQITKEARKDDILMSVRAPVGPVNIATERICIGRGLAAIRCNKDLDRDFLYYQLLHLQPEIAGHDGAVFPSINKSDIEALPISFIPLPEQQRVVRILDEAFAGIAVARANAEMNIQNAREVFESYLNDVFMKREKEWNNSTLGDSLSIIRNGLNCKQDKSENGTKVSRIESIWNGEFDFSRVGYAELSDPQKEKYLLKKDDILFSHINSSPHVGKTALFDGSEEVVHGVNLLLLRPRSDILPAFLHLYLKYIFGKGYWRGVCKQSINQASVNQQDINRVPFSYPDLTHQEAIVGHMAFFSIEIQNLEINNRQKLTLLSELRKSLLNSAFTGQL